MQAEKSELQKIIQTIWSSELYKIILSNPTGEGTSENRPEPAEEGMAGGAVYRETGIS